MKREVAFFRDRRTSTGRALVKAMRALGMTDDEIRAALTPAEAPAPSEPVRGQDGLELDTPAGHAPGGQGAAA